LDANLSGRKGKKVEFLFPDRHPLLRAFVKSGRVDMRTLADRTPLENSQESPEEEPLPPF
jgi:hypothetical protein